MVNQVLLFTLDGCGHCKNLKERLNKESLPFTEVEVGKNQELWNKIVEQTNNQFLPAFYIKQEGTNKGPFFCPEKDFKSDDEAVNIIKGYMVKKELGN
jgi:glutaredoxin